MLFDHINKGWFIWFGIANACSLTNNDLINKYFKVLLLLLIVRSVWVCCFDVIFYMKF